LQSIHPEADLPFRNKRSTSAFIQIRINRRTLIAYLVSLLLHLLALYIFSHWPKHAPVDNYNKPFEVSLAPPPPPQAKVLLPPEIVKPTPPKPPITPTPRIKIPTEPTPAPANNPNNSAQQPAPSKPAPPATPAPPLPTTPNQFTDLASYMKAKRAQRGEAEDSASTQDEQRNAASAPIPTGVNGVFRIESIDSRNAIFTFRGWKNELSYTHRETYQVEAPLDGDIRLEVIRKMIEIIRRYYSGDFNWNSYRLQQVVVLSARPEDNARLEEFLMKEFFT
jgi:type IV secretory pathway VirB10-like protein